MRVALFVTCLVDLFRPSVGFAAVRLLERAGCQVEVPRGQTCCGQPAYNNGDARTAKRIARQVIAAFADYPHVIIPSGSCAGMLIRHYPKMFADDPVWSSRAEDLASRSVELTAFLRDRLGEEVLDSSFPSRVAYHDSCSALRELKLREQPRELLGRVAGLSLAEIPDGEVCCGFGGTFCVKYPEISARMVSDKVANIEASGADTLVSGDMGCLLNIAGRLKRLETPIRVYHIAEILAGDADGTPAIGEGSAG